ncbi:MAG: MATE family efflux transporter [Planctomycetota bacterium]
MAEVPDKPGDVSKRPEFTSGGIGSHVVRLAVPSMLAMVFHTTYHLFDMIWLGRIGKEAIAAVAIYWMFWMVLAVFNQMVALGSFPLISQSYGAKDFDETGTVIGQTFIFKILFALPVTFVGYFFVYDAFLLYGAEEQVAIFGQDYGQIMLIGMPLYFSGFTLNTGFRSIGDVKKPMILAGITSLDPLFIFGFGWGIAGAAIASVLSQTIFLVVGLYIFFSGKTFVRLSLKDFRRPQLFWIRKFVRIGLPAVVGDACRFSAHFVMGWVVLGFGTAAMAAYGIGEQMFHLAWVPLFGIETAISTLVGQNIGAKKVDRAEKTVYWGTAFSLGIMSVLSVLGFIFAADFVMLFNSDPEVVEIGTQLIRIGAFAVMFMAATGGVGGAFWGSGNTIPLALISALSLWGIQLPLVFLFVKSMGLGVGYAWLSVLFGELGGCLLAIHLFSRGKWKKMKIREPQSAQEEESSGPA